MWDEKMYFFIDSNNLKEVETRLYGYSISPHDTHILVENDHFMGGKKISPNGAFVLVERTEGHIQISQDYMGAFGLYMYKCAEYFAISNSFEHLIDLLPRHLKLNLNEDFINYYLISSLSVHTCSETPFREITLLDRCVSVEIDLTSKKCSFVKNTYCEGMVKLGSKQSLQILDNWVEKWKSIISRLMANGYRVRTDLSGGFDSRLVFMLFVQSNVDLNSVFVHSIDDELHTHSEDFRIASKIANMYNFQINNSNNWKEDYFTLPLSDIVNNSYYAKSCSHKGMYFKKIRFKRKVFSFAGGGGEIHRKSWIDFDRIYSREVGRHRVVPKIFSEIVRESVTKIMDRTCRYIETKYGISGNHPDFGPFLYRDSRARYHSARAQVESYVSNEIILNPLLDWELGQISAPFDSFYAFLMMRYGGQLKDVEFEGNRSISANAWEYISDIGCSKYDPIIEKSSQLPIIESEISSCDLTNLSYTTSKEVVQFIEQTSNSGHISYLFSKYGNLDLKKYILAKTLSNPFNRLQGANGVISISKVYDVFQKHCEKKLFFDWIVDSFQNIHDSPVSDIYSARIDVRNVGTGCNVEVLRISDEGAICHTPTWVDGTQMIVSKKGHLRLVVKTHGCGQLRVIFRSNNVRGTNREKIPIYIDYIFARVNNTIVIDRPTSVWHDSPKYYNGKSNDGEVFEINVCWVPHNIRQTL